MYHSLYRKLYPRILVDLGRRIHDANRMTSRTTPIRDESKTLALMAQRGWVQDCAASTGGSAYAVRNPDAWRYLRYARGWTRPCT